MPVRRPHVGGCLPCRQRSLSHSANDRRRPDTTRHHRRHRRAQSHRTVRRRPATGNPRPPALLSRSPGGRHPARALLPGDCAGRPRPHAGQPRGLDPDIARSRPQGDVLPVGGVPDGSAVGRQSAQPRHRGRGASGPCGTRPGPRRGARVRRGARAWQRRPRQARGVLPRLAGHPRTTRDRIRHPLRVRHLRPGDPRRLAGREDRQLAGQREPVGDRQTRRELPRQLGRLRRALPR